MDRIGGRFGAHDDAHDDAGPNGFDPFDHYADPAPVAPLSPVGQDERRMQVRAYNHWAALLGVGNFPDIADLKPETLEDFGPYGVLLDFSGRKGVADPAIRFLGSRLAEECGTDSRFKRLSDVPGGSLLSRITDHYLQILANQAPIGFEAEFVNQRGAAVLYRGILLPWSSDGETIDFIFGVINWKEMADAATADALLSAIDAALGPRAAPAMGREEEHTMDSIRNARGFAASEDLDPFALNMPDNERGHGLPAPAFGAASEAQSQPPLDLVDEAEDEVDEYAGESSGWGAGFAGFGDEEPIYAVEYGEQGLEDGEYGDDVDDVVDPLADDSVGFGLASLVSRSTRLKQSVVLPGATIDQEVSLPPLVDTTVTDAVDPELMQQRPDTGLHDVHELLAEDTFELHAAFEEIGQQPDDVDDEELEAAFAAAFPNDEPEGLYDCLAAARELAQTARSSEDRGRKALYRAVSRAYDFSIEAATNPGDFDELLTENGLTVQERAPMTPIVKLVFGADYDKTRLTEYAAVLSYAHRSNVPRGGLVEVLAGAEGGLKAIVQAERRARKGGSQTVTASIGIRSALATRLRQLEPKAIGDLPKDGPEFALVMIRRLPDGDLAVLGEVSQNIPLVEKAARHLLA